MMAGPGSRVTPLAYLAASTEGGSSGMDVDLVAEAEALVPGAGGVTAGVLAQVAALAARCDQLEADNADLREKYRWIEGEMAAAEAMVSAAITEVAHLGQKLLRLSGPPTL